MLPFNDVPTTETRIFEIDRNEVARADEWIEALGRRWGESPRTIFGARICVAELFANVIEHGIAKSDRDRITVTLARRHDGIGIEFLDTCARFDPSAVTAPAPSNSISPRQLAGEVWCSSEPTPKSSTIVVIAAAIKSHCGSKRDKSVKDNHTLMGGNPATGEGIKIKASKRWLSGSQGFGDGGLARGLCCPANPLGKGDSPKSWQDCRRTDQRLTNDIQQPSQNKDHRMQR